MEEVTSNTSFLDAHYWELFYPPDMENKNVYLKALNLTYSYEDIMLSILCDPINYQIVDDAEICEINWSQGSPRDKVPQNQTKLVTRTKKGKNGHKGKKRNDQKNNKDNEGYDSPGNKKKQENIQVTERRGGLTWYKYEGGYMVPSIENTWLKHVLVALLQERGKVCDFVETLRRNLEGSIRFLYKEGIKPYLGDVANQMKRLIPDNFWSASEIAFISLMCMDKLVLQVEQRVKGELGWVLYLRETPNNFEGFVDTHSIVDNFSDYHWRAMNTYAVEIMTADHARRREDATGYAGAQGFTGGRYAFAERMRREVPAFKSMRLGEVIHLVQLGIYSGIFVYSQRILLPVTACEKTAEEMFPSLKKSKHPVCSTIEEVKLIISALVDNHGNGLVLAQLKQQFLMKFNRELDPLVFGFRKLQNLLLSEHFRDEYRLFVPIDCPHRTHIQHKSYAMPIKCRLFEQAKLQLDPRKFCVTLDDLYDSQYMDMDLDSLPYHIRSAIMEVLESDDEEDSAEEEKRVKTKGKTSDLQDFSTDVPSSFMSLSSDDFKKESLLTQLFTEQIWEGQ